MNLKTGYKKLRITSSVFLVLVCAVVFCALVIFFFLIKSNKKTDISAEITALNNSIRTHYQKSIDYRGLNTSFALENGIVPAFMSRHNKIFSTLKTEILIGRDASGNTIMPMESFFNIFVLDR